MTKYDINNDHNLRSFIVEGKLEMPFDDFEEKVMDSIDKEVVNTIRLKKLISKSWLFYIVGLFFGLFSPTLINYISFPVGVNKNMVVLVFQVIFALAALFFLEKLIRITFKKIN